MRLENSKNVEGNYRVYLNERSIQKHYFKICITVKKFGELQYTNLVVIKTYVYFYHFLLPHAQTPQSLTLHCKPKILQFVDVVNWTMSFLFGNKTVIAAKCL